MVIGVSSVNSIAKLNTSPPTDAAKKEPKKKERGHKKQIEARNRLIPSTGGSDAQPSTKKTSSAPNQETPKSKSEKNLSIEYRHSQLKTLEKDSPKKVNRSINFVMDAVRASTQGLAANAAPTPLFEAQLIKQALTNSTPKQATPRPVQPSANASEKTPLIAANSDRPGWLPELQEEGMKLRKVTQQAEKNSWSILKKSLTNLTFDQKANAAPLINGQTLVSLSGSTPLPATENTSATSSNQSQPPSASQSNLNTSESSLSNSKITLKESPSGFKSKDTSTALIGDKNSIFNGFKNPPLFLYGYLTRGAVINADDGKAKSVFIDKAKNPKHHDAVPPWHNFSVGWTVPAVEAKKAFTATRIRTEASVRPGNSNENGLKRLITSGQDALGRVFPKSTVDFSLRTGGDLFLGGKYYRFPQNARSGDLGLPTHPRSTGAVIGGEINGSVSLNLSTSAVIHPFEVSAGLQGIATVGAGAGPVGTPHSARLVINGPLGSKAWVNTPSALIATPTYSIKNTSHVNKDESKRFKGLEAGTSPEHSQSAQHRLKTQSGGAVVLNAAGNIKTFEGVASNEPNNVLSRGFDGIARVESKTNGITKFFEPKYITVEDAAREARVYGMRNKGSFEELKYITVARLIAANPDKVIEAPVIGTDGKKTVQQLISRENIHTGIYFPENGKLRRSNQLILTNGTQINLPNSN
jgi:hypothetical protein